MDSSEKSRFVQFLQSVKRSRREKILGGVCGGFAAQSDVPVWAYRALFITFSVLSIGVFAYVALWILMPTEGISESAAQNEPNPKSLE